MEGMSGKPMKKSKGTSKPPQKRRAPCHPQQFGGFMIFFSFFIWMLVTAALVWTLFSYFSEYDGINFFWALWLSMQLTSILLLAIDKASATVGTWRVSSATLFCTCYAGAAGAMLGTFLVNHKKINRPVFFAKNGDYLKHILPKLIPMFFLLVSLLPLAWKDVVGPYPFRWWG